LLLKHNAVSGVHCAVINTGGEIYMRDLLSRNGTYLNDLRAEQEHLEDGDVITIRPWQLRVAVVVPKLDDSSDVTGLGLEPAPAVIALEEIGTKRVRQLTREVNLIGRRHGCDLVVDDRSVSRAHAIIFTYLSRVAIFDLMSQNETLVNGQAVTFSTLQSDDLLSLGTVDMRVKIVAPSPKARSSGNGQAIKPQDPDGSFSDRIDIRAAEIDRRGRR
jgi:pSer/pThr/pTyr-binding forkhead associated (FHA) protein